jgi:hypothetical protein
MIIRVKLEKGRVSCHRLRERFRRIKHPIVS